MYIVNIMHKRRDRNQNNKYLPQIQKHTAESIDKRVQQPDNDDARRVIIPQQNASQSIELNHQRNLQITALLSSNYLYS